MRRRVISCQARRKRNKKDLTNGKKSGKITIRQKVAGGKIVKQIEYTTEEGNHVIKKRIVSDVFDNSNIVSEHNSVNHTFSRTERIDKHQHISGAENIGKKFVSDYFKEKKEGGGTEEHES